MIPTYTENVTFGDGATVTFDYDFRVTDDEFLGVAIWDVLTGAVTTLDPAEYTVAGVGNDIGGTVTLLNYVPLATDKVVRFLNRPLNQGTTLYNQGGFFPFAVEQGLDAVTQLIQQLNTVAGRSIRGPAGDVFEPLPGPAARANKMLYFNTDGIPNVGAAIANINIAATSALSHTSAKPNTYPFTLYQDLEWDRLSTLQFLSPAQRLNTRGVDCWESLQNMADFLSADNGSTTEGPYKTMRLDGKIYALSQALEGTGYQTAGGVRRGRIMIEYGGFMALGARASQALNPEPLLYFHDNAQAFGIDHLYIDCKGLCSGLCIEPTGGNSKFDLSDSRIVNVYNPEKPTQADLYTNLVDVGVAPAQTWVSAAPARRYESSAAHPYCIRLGMLDVTDDTTSSMTGRLSGMHCSQWEVGHTNLQYHSKRTAVGLWCLASDTYLAGKMNNFSDCLKSAIFQGHSNKIFAYHSSPEGKISEYAVGDAPTSAVLAIGTENLDGMNYYIGCYHERLMWLQDPAAFIMACSFPRNDESPDGNDSCIILDARKAGDAMGPKDKPIIANNIRGKDQISSDDTVPLAWVKYRAEGLDPDDGVTPRSWTRHTDFETGEGHLMFGSKTWTFAVADSGGRTVARFHSNNDTKADILLKTATGTEEFGIGVEIDQGVLKQGLDLVAFFDMTGFEINSDRLRIITSRTPASATDPGNAGDVCWDAGFIYVCVATDTWKRVAIATW